MDARERSSKTGFFIFICGIIIKNVHEKPLTQADIPGRTAARTFQGGYDPYL
jgi:hypothetical protein